MITGLEAFGAVIALVLCGFACAVAQAKIGCTIMHKMAKHPEISFGKYLTFITIPESILIFGFVVAVLIILVV